VASSSKNNANDVKSQRAKKTDSLVCLILLEVFAPANQPPVDLFKQISMDGDDYIFHAPFFLTAVAMALQSNNMTCISAAPSKKFKKF
jgi:hypothetical protein